MEPAEICHHTRAIHGAEKREETDLDSPLHVCLLVCFHGWLTILIVRSLSMNKTCTHTNKYVQADKPSSTHIQTSPNIYLNL